MLHVGVAIASYTPNEKIALRSYFFAVNGINPVEHGSIILGLPSALLSSASITVQRPAGRR
jgi:hypothetical protein